VNQSTHLNYKPVVGVDIRVEVIPGHHHLNLQLVQHLIFRKLHVFEIRHSAFPQNTPSRS